jgi:hypothetical protein
MTRRWLRLSLLLLAVCAATTLPGCSNSSDQAGRDEGRRAKPGDDSDDPWSLGWRQGAKNVEEVFHWLDQVQWFLIRWFPLCCALFALGIFASFANLGKNLKEISEKVSSLSSRLDAIESRLAELRDLHAKANTEKRGG